MVAEIAAVLLDFVARIVYYKNLMGEQSCRFRRGGPFGFGPTFISASSPNSAASRGLYLIVHALKRPRHVLKWELAEDREKA